MHSAVVKRKLVTFASASGVSILYALVVCHVENLRNIVLLSQASLDSEHAQRSLSIASMGE